MPALSIVDPRKRRPSQLPQRLMLRERILQKEMREIRKELEETRRQIRCALEHGAAPEPGLRSAEIEIRKVLIVR